MNLIDTLTALVTDPQAAGLRITTRYQSPAPTVKPPAGSLRDAQGNDVDGEFTLPDGTDSVTLDSPGSQASRMEAAAETLADRIGLPMVRFVDTDGTLLTTSLRLSHRHADATWRAAHPELRAAGIPFDDIQNATIDHPDALATWFPTAILLGWWHSRTVKAPAATKTGTTTADPELAGVVARNDLDIAEALAGYATPGDKARSERVVTAEIIAHNTHRRLRLAARHDQLLGALKGKISLGGKSDVKPSTLGLGSLPPVPEKAPVEVTYASLDGYWYLSLSTLRRFTLPPQHAATLAALAIALHLQAQTRSSLRSGTELVVAERTVEIWRHGHAPQPITLPDVDDLLDEITAHAPDLGWTGPMSVTITPDSILGRLVGLLAHQQDTAE